MLDRHHFSGCDDTFSQWNGALRDARASPDSHGYKFRLTGGNNYGILNSKDLLDLEVLAHIIRVTVLIVNP